MWHCPHCDETVDDAFAVCWACGTTAEGVEDPNFLTADDSPPIDDPMSSLDPEWGESLDDFEGTPLPDLVPCYTADSITEAKFLADRLFEEGIPALPDRQNINMVLGGFRPEMWGCGPKVRVRPEDLPRALNWLKGYVQHRRDKLRAESLED